MGIPSYFRKLVDNYKGLLCRNKPGTVGWLMFDFNCLMYHVLRRPDCPEYRADERASWEKAYLDEIARYTLKVIRQVEPTRGVYIAIDGVAPMAKIKQQRMRRFKVGESATPGGDSLALAPPIPPSHGEHATSLTASATPLTVQSVGGYGGLSPPSWDKNALTPGTAFMSAVSGRLQALIRDYQPAGQRWLLSDTTEAGEGEQKIVTQIRAGLCTGDEGVVVYGLDADLIVLSLWTRAIHMAGRPMWLFRERIERGEMVRNAVGEEQFEWFNIAVLEDAVCSEGGVQGEQKLLYLQDYCAAMMLLGNDFLPTSMTFRLKEGGHGRLLELVEKARKVAGTGRLWSAETGLDLAGWRTGLQYLSYGEEGRFKRAVEKKLMAKGDDTEPEDAPLRWRADAVFLNGTELVADWRKLYAQIAFGGEGGRRAAVEKYIEGMNWVVDYYTGRPISMEWFYPWHFPPLWEDVVAGLKERGWRAPPAPGARLLKPVEQLAMVLPLRSWDLIPAGEAVRRLPEISPEWFPEHFELQSIGKRFTWECEPEIPIPTPAQVWAVVG